MACGELPGHAGAVRRSPEEMGELQEFDATESLRQVVQPVREGTLEWLQVVGKSYGVVSLVTLASIWVAYWEIRRSRIATERLLETLLLIPPVTRSRQSGEEEETEE